MAESAEDSDRATGNYGHVGDGGIDAIVRRIRSRVPLWVIWLFLSALSMAALRIIDPHTRGFEYAQSPVFIGVAFLASRVVPKRHLGWLPVLIAAPVSLMVTLSWKALS